MDVERSERRQRKMRQRQRTGRIARWLSSEPFAVGTGRRFQFTLPSMFTVVTWSAVVLGISLWIARSGFGLELGKSVGIAIVFLLGIGFPATVIGHWGYIRRARHWPRVNAQVVRYWISRDSEGRASYRPVFSFRTLDGNTYVAISGYASDRKWSRGASVSVQYDPLHPNRVELPELLRSLEFQVAVAVPLSLGFSGLVVGLFIYFALREPW